MALSQAALERIKKLKGQINDGSLRNTANGGTAGTTASTGNSSTLSSSALERIGVLKGKINDGSLRNSTKVIDDSYINQFVSDANRFLHNAQYEYDGLNWGNASSRYDSKSTELLDLDSRSRAIGEWLYYNRDNIGEEAYNNVSNYLNEFSSAASKIVGSFKGASDFYSQFDTEEQYNFWDTHSTPEKRQQWYTDQQSRLDALKAEKEAENKRWGAVDPIEVGINSPEWQQGEQEHLQKLKTIDNEIAAIETEINNYKRGNYNKYGQHYGNKTVDDYTSNLKDPAFLSASANRDYDNPTREDLRDFDSTNSDALEKVFSYDGEHYRDRNGNIVEYIDDPGVEDKLGLFLSYTDKDVLEAYHRLSLTGGNYTDTWANLMKEGDQGAWRFLKEEEISVYYGLLAESQESAYKFLEDMNTELNRRRTMDDTAKLQKLFSEANALEKIGLSLATTPFQLISGVAGTIANTADFIAGEEINPYSRAHSGLHFSSTVRGLQAAELDEMTGGFAVPLVNFTLGDAYQSGMSILDSYAAIGIGGKLGGLILATGAASSEAQRLYEQGATMGQVALGSAAAGAAEMVFESLSIDRLISMKSSKTIKEAIVNALIQGGVEASEEGFTEIANILTNAVIMGQQSDWAKLVEEHGGNTFGAFLSEVQSVVHASVSGFLSGVGSGSVPSAISYAGTQSQYRQTGRDIMSADGGVEALRTLAMDVAGVSDTKMQKNLTKLSSKVEKKAKAKNVGKLRNAVSTAYNAQNKADIVTILEMNRFDSQTANDIADAIVAVASGQQLTDKQAETLKAYKNNDHVRDVINNYDFDDSHSIGKRNKALSDFDSDVKAGIMLKEFTEKVFTPEGKYEVSSKGKATVLETDEVDGKTITKDTGEVIDIKGVKEVRITEVDGKEKVDLILDIGDGKEINSKNVAYANKKDALIYEAIASLGDKVDAKTANKLIGKYDGGNAMVFARGIAQAYTYGFYGFDRSEMMAKHSLATELTEEQRNFAYGIGEQYRSVKDANDKTKAIKELAKSGKTPSAKGVYYRGKDGNSTDISTYLKESNIKLNNLQKTGIEAMRKMSKMMGVRFNVFESWVENGKNYYLDAYGDVVEGNPNGFYDTTTGEIYIDLNAGNNFEGTMLFTVAHELTHFMRQWSPKHFTKIAKIVFQHGGMKGNVSELVALKQAKAKAKGKPISYDVAMEEVVADGMETILKDGKVVEFMADVKKQDYAAWEKLKGWFKNLAKFLRKMV